MLPLTGDASPAPLFARNSLRYQRAAGRSQPWACGGWGWLSGDTSPRLSSCPYLSPCSTRTRPSLCAWCRGSLERGWAAGNHGLAPAPAPAPGAGMRCLTAPCPDPPRGRWRQLSVSLFCALQGPLPAGTGIPPPFLVG